MNPVELGSSRRRILLGSAALSAGALGGVPIASADDDGEDDGNEDDSDVDQPEGFSAEVLAPPASFPDEVAAMFSTTYGERSIDSNLPCDASNLMVVRLNWEPGGTTGWHPHPGVGIVNVTNGELELVDAHDCTTRTYTAGEAFLDPGGHAHKANNASDSEPAEPYVTFLGVPEGKPPTEGVEPQDC